MTAFRTTRKRVFVCMVAFAIIFFIFCSEDIHYFFYFHHIRRNGTATKQYVINTTGCRIPYLEQDDEEIVNLYQDVSGYKCSNLLPLVESNLTSLFVNANALIGYGVGSIAEVDCSYKPFWRRPPAHPEEDDVQVEFGESVYFHRSVNIPDEFVRVECTYNGNKYIDYHSFVPLKPTKSKLDTKRQHSNENLNVLIVGIDSLSRVHLHRKMPKTVKYVLEELKAIEYMGYNKVSDNTFPNLMPMLTSYSFEELVQQCWPNYNTRFDNCSFVWSNYTRQGYVTSFAEEQSFFGLFNYLKKGWLVQPTDYYWDTFDYAALQELEHWYDLYRLYPVCMGPRPMYRVLLSSAEKFIATMARDDRRFFTFYWDTSLAHNHIDTPALADQLYVDHFKFIKDTGVLNNSLVIFMSDHGYRFGKMAQTHQGHLEDRLPFLYWILPEWFQKKYKVATRNLKENAFKLTTTFDIHATLNHLLLLDELADEKVRLAEVPDVKGVSLFHAVREERTCDTGGIPAHYCTCQEALPVDTSDPVVQKVADFTVGHLNRLLAGHQGCSSLSPVEVTSASLVTYGDVYHSHKHTVSDYTVTVRATPGGGLFDATVRCTRCVGDDFLLTGTVDRLNRYDNQSYCIKDFILKLYCYCTTQLK